MNNKEKIRSLLEEALPLVDFDSDFLFSELDSLGVTTILMILSKEFDIELESRDATPKNFKTLDSLVALVENKLGESLSRPLQKERRTNNLSLLLYHLSFFIYHLSLSAHKGVFLVFLFYALCALNIDFFQQETHPVG